jgi:hypothetical protein
VSLFGAAIKLSADSRYRRLFRGKRPPRRLERLARGPSQ